MALRFNSTMATSRVGASQRQNQGRWALVLHVDHYLQEPGLRHSAWLTEVPTEHPCGPLSGRRAPPVSRGRAPVASMQGTAGRSAASSHSGRGVTRMPKKAAHKRQALLPESAGSRQAQRSCRRPCPLAPLNTPAASRRTSPRAPGKSQGILLPQLS